MPRGGWREHGIDPDIGLAEPGAHQHAAPEPQRFEMVGHNLEIFEGLLHDLSVIAAST
jgi:hypothetical protein